MVFDLEGIYAPVGVNLGAALRGEGDNGFLLGGELSLVRLWPELHDMPMVILGGYGDFVHDFGSDTRRLSFGPEFGAYLMGIDLGPVFEWAPERSDVGGRARFFGSLGAVTLYVGEGYVFTRSTARFSTELGLLLKFPIPIASCGHAGGCRWGKW